MAKGTIAKLSNAFSTGNGGGNFERRVQAVFALALIIDGFSPIIDTPVKELHFQAKHLGYDIDDLVVTPSASRVGGKLLCQIKHSLAITKNDSTFQEVINAAWSDFKKPIFNANIDRIALITGFIAKDSIQALRYIHGQALAEASADSFISRLYQANYSSTKTCEKFEAVRHCLQKANHNIPVTNEEIWKFCRCFVLAVFDLDYEESINRVLVRSLIQCKSKYDSKLVWSRLADQCGDWNQQAATVTRDNIPNDILELFSGEIRVVSEVKKAFDFTPNSTIAAISLIGCWDEGNERDVSAIEQVTGICYDEFQCSCREFLICNPDFLSLRNGVWRVKDRKQALDAIHQFFFDSIIKDAFRIVEDYLKENSKQFSEDGQFNIIIPHTGRFSNSEGFRKGLLEGLCMLANGPVLENCTDGLLAHESNQLIRNVFTDCDWMRLVSISDIISILAELNPDAYLNYLEELIRTRPEEIEKLFPKNRDRALIDQNFSTSILFSLERLAWIEDYLVSCIRCLGELENLNYEETNWANTPINTIVKILTPFMPQTRASIAKQKNAVQALKVDHPNLCWNVLIGLLPRGRSVTITGSARLQYIQIDIPEELSMNSDDRSNLFGHYAQQAISMVGTNSDRLTQISDHIEYMRADDILLLLDKMRSLSETWEEDEKCGLWIKLSELKYREIHSNKGNVPDTPLFKKLCETIDCICPHNIFFRHKRLYLSHFNEFLLDENRWEEIEEQKQRAVEEIFSTLGWNGVIEFGDSVNALHDVGSRLGRYIRLEELSDIISEDRTGNRGIFFSCVVSAFLNYHGVSALKKLNLLSYEPELRAIILRDAPFTRELIDLIPEYLPGKEKLFWETVNISPYYARYSDYDVENVIRTLLSYHRAPAAIYLVGHSIEKLKLDSSLLCEMLMQAPLDSGSQNIHQYSVQKIIKYLQNSENRNIEALSDIEYIYLPWLDRYSSVKPKAINYRLANEPSYFCEIIQTTYKQRHDTAKPKELPRAVSDRLFQLTYHFNIIPGTDWDGEFDADKFTSWMNAVKMWTKENDRFEVAMHTVGNGLSFAKFNDDHVADSVIMAELNSADNEELRRGFRLGVINQRGAHWVDPEGKAERKLAATYQKRADAVEQLGYSRFADLLRSISAGYLAEAEDNAKRFCDEDD